MGEDIEDKALFSIIDKMFKKVLKGSELLSISEGRPQGNILSPLLSNIYFSKLDAFIETDIISRYTKGN